jgi:hypothetical protein
MDTPPILFSPLFSDLYVALSGRGDRVGGHATQGDAIGLGYARLSALRDAIGAGYAGDLP